MTDPERILMRERGVAPQLVGATSWLNSAPLTPEQLRGKVVMYVFWTYTCINWLRSLPYVRAWETKYRPHGLVVVGVHTPEFVFEQDLTNVARAVQAQDVQFAVVLDSKYEIWRSFDNHYWPALYLADHRGVLRYEHFGEGRYVATERAVQQLLLDAGADIADDHVEPDGQGVEAPADWDELRTPETYLGSARGDGVASVSDEWAILADRIATRRPGGAISVPFHARDLHLVMKSSDPGGPVRFRVTLDGQAPGDGHGLDVDASGAGVLAEPRMYQLIRQRPPITDRVAEISFPDGGVDAFVITFG